MKKLLFLLLTFILSLLLAIVTFAHSGKTDSRGGHYDRSTGEYHYHHGYSAHDHYDMDGDGVKDCPYDFEDKTDRFSSSKSGKSKTKTIKDDKKEADALSIGQIIEIILQIVLLSFFILLVFGLYIYWLVEALIETIFKCKEDTVKRASLIITFVIVVVIAMVLVL